MTIELRLFLHHNWFIWFIGKSTHSGGLAFISRTPITPFCVSKDLSWATAIIMNIKILNVYLPSSSFHARRDWLSLNLSPSWDSCLAGGDFNTRRFNEDSSNGKDTNLDASALNDAINELNWTDAYAAVGKGSRFTFLSPSNSASRIDYFFIPTSLVSSAIVSEVMTSGLSDHYPLSLTLVLAGVKAKRGDDLWRMNRAIINDNFINFISPRALSISTFAEFTMLKEDIKLEAILREKKNLS